MPSSIVHLFVANSIKNALGVTDEAQFYLGAISPDAVNLDGFASEKVRYTAHLRSKKVSEWLENIKDFAEKNAVFYKDQRDFFKGFLVHLLTDIAWDEEVQPRLFRQLRATGVSEKDLKQEKWAEIYRFNNLLFKNVKWERIKADLSCSTPVGIFPISTELLGKFTQKVLLSQNNVTDFSMPKILKMRDIEVTSAKVLKIYFENLSKFSL